MENSNPISRRAQARNAQRPALIPNPSMFNIRVENGGKIVVYDVATAQTVTHEGIERIGSPDKKNPFLDIAEIDRLSFVVIDDGQFFLNGLLLTGEGDKKEWFDSTPYRLRSDEITVYMRKKNEAGGMDSTKVIKAKVCDLKPRGEESEDETEAETAKRIEYKYAFEKLSSCQYLWAYCPQLGGLCRIQLTATGRNTWRKFLKSVKSNESPDFTITGFHPVFSPDSKTKRQADAPTFEKYIASNIDSDLADSYLDKTAAYTKMDMSVFEAPKPETVPAQIPTFDDLDEIIGNSSGEDLPDDLPM